MMEEVSGVAPRSSLGIGLSHFMIQARALNRSHRLAGIISPTTDSDPRPLSLTPSVRREQHTPDEQACIMSYYRRLTTTLHQI
jgi:hypothetical protein